MFETINLKNQKYISRALVTFFKRFSGFKAHSTAYSFSKGFAVETANQGWFSIAK